MTLRDAAVEYAIERKWHVFPIYPLMKEPHSLLVPQGFKEATSYAPDLLYWWERQPDANIGLACRKSALVVIDVDPRNGGLDSLYDLECSFGELPRTCSAQTATGGEHIFFQHPMTVEFKKEIAPGVDIKDNGYVLLAPSVRYMGSYTWDNDGDPSPIPSAWLSAMTRAPTQNQPHKAVLSPSDEPLMHIPSYEYARVLTGRETSSGWMQCPWHKEGKERTPSLKLDDSRWCCFVCEPWGDKQRAGGNIVDFAARLWGYALPVTGVDLQEVMSRLHQTFEPL